MTKLNLFWKNKESLNHYFNGINISIDDVHYAYNYPGESRLRLLGNIQGKNTLEIGCGAGQNSIALAKMGAIAHGIDISSEMLLRARQNAKKHKVKIRLEEMSAENVGKLKSSFDLAVSSYVLDYVENLPAVFRGLGKILAPGGVFVFSCCHPDQMPESASKSRLGTFFIDGTWPQTNIPTRNYFHPIDFIRKSLAQGGLELDQTINATTPKKVSKNQMLRYPYKVPINPRQAYDPRPHTLIVRAIKPN